MDGYPARAPYRRSMDEGLERGIEGNDQCGKKTRNCGEIFMTGFSGLHRPVPCGGFDGIGSQVQQELACVIVGGNAAIADPRPPATAPWRGRSCRRARLTAAPLAQSARSWPR